MLGEELAVEHALDREGHAASEVPKPKITTASEGIIVEKIF
jgi:hypothetical protein